MRLAYARIAQESNALSVLDTVLEDFHRTHFVEGAELAAACSRGGTEAEGFLRNAELSGFLRAVAAANRRGAQIVAVPLFSAWAVPGGPLSVETFEALRDQLLQELHEKGPFDGVYLCLHGAMCARDIEDPESKLLAAVRAVIGDAPLAVTHDLHANLTVERVQYSDILVGYRTNPHRDHVRCGQKAGELLIQQLTGQIRPTTAWRSLPMFMGGGSTIDFLPTMRPLFKWMTAQEKNPRVLNCCLYMCNPWNDSPDLGWSTHIITDNDPDLAEALAEELADLAWGVKDVPPPACPTPSEAIAKARDLLWARKTGAILFSDASDVVTTGTIGENTRLIKALLEQADGLLCYAAVRDAEVVAKLWGLPIGEQVTVQVGGKINPERDQPIEVSGRILRKQPTQPFGDIVVLDLDHLKLCVTAGQPTVMKPAFYADLGLNPWRADVIVVKNLFPFRLFFAHIARRTFYVQTKGISDLDAVAELTFREPLFPQADVEYWRPTDRRRRLR